MKRGEPLKRKTPLRARSRLKADPAKALRRTTRIAPRSLKRQRVMVERRALVAALLEANPVCQALIRGVCQGRAVDVHERLTRARAGDANAAILDPANCCTVCRACHDWVGAHPVQAQAMGLVRWSWEGR